ncbi:Rv3235 family protein [Spongiactinospora sp. TRM90649]|uniref:Rv3235 family protein n=1 Tax=Spongiactinospora sp. TRM90649 TaxID=3031114 RepID=UPI0023F7CABE|nr:Rv3235 family protein [Spongiactinospora sp. TRM90649]MDF5751366.1 Rv3235 family protein [Spongiactinospora sp. TRM90649]
MSSPLPIHLVPMPRFGSSPIADPPYEASAAGAPAPGNGSRTPPVPYPRGGPGGARMLDSYVSAVPATPDERRLQALGLAFAEVLAGVRLPGTVAAHATERTYGELVRAGKIIEADGTLRVSAPHISRPGADALEMCLLVHCGRRSRVLAMRMERRGPRWLCTDFETTP